MGKYHEISLKTKQNIVDAFWSIYSKKRIERITVQEITQKAGYNRSTFYQYFKDIYDILDYVENSLLPELEELPLDQQDDVVLEKFINLYHKQSKYYNVLFGENGDPAFMNKMKSGIKAKLSEHLNVDYSLILDYQLEFKLSGMIGILLYWYQNDENISKKELVTVISQYMK